VWRLPVAVLPLALVRLVVQRVGAAVQPAQVLRRAGAPALGHWLRPLAVVELR